MEGKSTLNDLAKTGKKYFAVPKSNFSGKVPYSLSLGIHNYLKLICA